MKGDNSARMAGPAPRILVVEHDPRLVIALEDVLVREGYEVTVARNGREGIDAVVASLPPPDLVLLDLEMPAIGATECARWLKDHRLGIPVVVATSHDDVSLAELGAVGRLSKPYDPDEILAVIVAIVPSPGRRITS